jgi:hypothetical protein
MIVHKLNGNTGNTKLLFEAEFDRIRRGKAEFVGEGKYISSIGSFDSRYRLDFPNQEELKAFIEELIELYNSREEKAA